MLRRLLGAFPRRVLSSGRRFADAPEGVKMAAFFKCTVCGSRQGPKHFSRVSYEQGVVLAQCDSCRNHHILADNLGWFSDMAGHRNVEEVLRARGEQPLRLSTAELVTEFLAKNKA